MTRRDDGIVDEIAVERAAAGEPLNLTKAERFAAFEVLFIRGHSASEIAKRMHCCVRTVERHRRELREQWEQRCEVSETPQSSQPSLADWVAA
jgi:DNA-binding NarL/FixJ family response regulator